MAYTKKVGSYAKVTIDGTDVSNSFSEFRLSSENESLPAGGFSATGIAEQLPGQRTQGFTGTAFHTEQLSLLVWPIHNNRTSVRISYQPDGLVDPTREIYAGNCFINVWEPGDTFGDVSTMNFSATAADATGIVPTDFT